MDFFRLNWIIVFVTLFFLLIFIYLEARYEFVSEKINIHPFKLYSLLFILGALTALMNYIALRIFGSWKLLVIFLIISLIVLLLLISFIRKRIKRFKKDRELKKLREENEKKEAELQAMAEKKKEQTKQLDLPEDHQEEFLVDQEDGPKSD